MKVKTMNNRLFGVLTILVLTTLTNGHPMRAAELNPPHVQFSKEAVGEITGINFERGYLKIGGRRYSIDPRTLIVYSNAGTPLNLGRLNTGWKARFNVLPWQGRRRITEIHLIAPVSPPNE